MDVKISENEFSLSGFYHLNPCELFLFLLGNIPYGLDFFEIYKILINLTIKFKTFPKFQENVIT